MSRIARSCSAGRHREPLGDRGVDGAAPGRHLADARTSSSPWAIRSLSRYARPLCPLPSSAIAYASSSCADRTTTPVPGCFSRIACAQSMPSSWKFGGILMSVTTTSGVCASAACSSVGGVLGHADHLDVLVGVEQRSDTLPDEDVVLPEHHLDGHVGPPPPARGYRSRVRAHSLSPPTPLYDSRMVRVVFAEDNYLVREGTAALLQASDEVELVGTAESLDELLAAVEEFEPEVVLTDIRMPPSNTTEGIDAARRIRADHPDIGVVVLSQFAEEEYAFELLKDGAAGLGYLFKERVSDLDEIVRALNEVAKGGSVLDPKVVEALVAAKDRMAHSPLATLTDREREVLENMAQGKNNAAIAKSMFLTERAVEKHINSLFHKLGLSEEVDVHRRVMAVLAFLHDSTPA